MYKPLFALLITARVTTAMCVQQDQSMNNKHSSGKILVAYFSATGTTARAVEKLVEIVGGDLYPITPIQSYISTDLDWNNKQSHSSVEMNNPKIHPAIRGKKENIGAYDVVFIGYHIWWGPAPRIINTFIENYGLKGKTVVPFVTSGDSLIGNSTTVLEKAYPGLDRKERRLLSRTDGKAVRARFDVVAMR